MPTQTLNRPSGAMLRRYISLEVAFSWAGIVVLFLLVFHPVLRADFDLIDDHEILRFASSTPVHPQVPDSLKPVGSIWDIAIKREHDLGRFRPVYYVFRFGEVALFGLHARVWHLATLTLGALSCFLFYTAARKMGADPIAAGFFVIWIALTGGATEIFVRLGPAETLGTLLTAVAIWAATNAARNEQANRWDGVALAALLLAGWTKESFVLVIPAILLLRLMLDSWFHSHTWLQTLRQLWLVVGVGGLIFVGQMAIVMLFLRSGQITSRVSHSSVSLEGWLYKLIALRSLVAFYLAIGCALLLAPHWPGKRLSSVYVPLVVLTVIAWVVPQFVLYGRTPAFANRYLYPTIIGVAALNAFGLAVLWRLRLWILLVACLAVSGFLAVKQGANSYNYAAEFSAQTRALNRMLVAVAETAGDTQVVILASDPVVHYEATASLMVHLGTTGYKAPIYLVLITDLDESNKQVQGLKRRYAGFIDVEALRPSQVGAIIKLVPLADFNAHAPGWYHPAEWQTRAFTETYQTVSLRGRVTHVASYEVLIPRAD